MILKYNLYVCINFRFELIDVSEYYTLYHIFHRCLSRSHLTPSQVQTLNFLVPMTHFKSSGRLFQKCYSLYNCVNLNLSCSGPRNYEVRLRSNIKLTLSNMLNINWKLI